MPALRAAGGIKALQISHVAHPDYRFSTPSGKIEFVSARAAALGLPPLPLYVEASRAPQHVALAQGRTLTHFHSFYDHGQALPSLASLDAAPSVWISPVDAHARGLTEGAPCLLANARGQFTVQAHVTERVPAGTVWMRDGWEGLNRLTSGRPCIPDAAVDTFHFAAGQAEFETFVELTSL